MSLMPAAHSSADSSPSPNAIRRRGWFGIVLILCAVTSGAFASEPRGAFIVLYPFNELAEVADEWAAYRDHGGWTVETHAIPDILDLETTTTSLLSDAERAHRIRVFIRERVREARALGIEPHNVAVLLLGDVVGPTGEPGIPAFYEQQTDPDLAPPWSSEPANQCSDGPYQFVDDDDALPDIMLGRVPAQTPEQARAVLSKIRRYENQSPSGEWRRRITYLASPGRFGPQLDRLLEGMFRQMVEQIVPYTFDVNMTYASANSPYCAAPSQFNDIVMNRLNEGALLINYVGHGAATRLDQLYWRDEMYPICDRRNVVRDLDPTNQHLPIMVIIACSAGRYDLPRSRQSLSESLLFHPGGPVGIVAGSRITHPYPNAVFQKDLTEQLCHERRPLLGQIDLFATRALMEPDPDDLKMEWLIATPLARGMGWATTPRDLRAMHVGLYNLLGDPATQIAYPAGEVSNIMVEPASVTGTVDSSLAGANVRVTLEAARTDFPFRDQMSDVTGNDDPDLETKAMQNYPLANAKVLAEASGNVDTDGSFRVPWTDSIEGHRPRSRWVKVYVSHPDGGDAFGATPVVVDDSRDAVTKDR